MKAKIKITKEQWDEINHAIARIKLMVGIGNNAAWAACLDAYDTIKRHPRFNTLCKGGVTPKEDFERAFKEFKRYERNLKYTSVHNNFKVSQLTPEARKRYGDITNEQMYDLWTATGSGVYQNNYAFFTSLVNKQRLACINHDVPAPDVISWAFAASNVLYIAVETWEQMIPIIAKESPKLVGTYGECYIIKFYKEYFKDFCLKNAYKAWNRAVEDLFNSKDIVLTEMEEKNILQGCNQIAEKWFNPSNIQQSRIKSIQDYSEMWRTEGEMKKLIREYSEGAI